MVNADQMIKFARKYDENMAKGRCTLKTKQNQCDIT